MQYLIDPTQEAQRFQMHSFPQHKGNTMSTCKYANSSMIKRKPMHIPHKAARY